MYKVVITFIDGTTVVREVFGKIRAYALYYSAKRNPDVNSVEIKGGSI